MNMFSPELDRRRSWCSVLVLAPALDGCATRFPQAPERSSSTAFDQPMETGLGRFFQAELAAHPDKSGVAMITTSEWGFRAGRVCCWI